MKKILYIAYYLREDMPTASRRAYNNCRFLAQDDDFQIDVISSAALGKRTAADFSSISPNVKVYAIWPALIESVFRKHLRKVLPKVESTAKKINLTSYCWPDWALDWSCRAAIKALLLFRKNNYDLIITDSFPYSSHLAGLALKLLTKKPWVIEMRDGWIIDEDIFAPPAKWLKRLHEIFFGIIIKHCQQIWYPTPWICDRYKGKYPEQAAKMRAFPLGYDEQFCGADPAKQWTKTLNIVYAGFFFKFFSTQQFFLGPLVKLFEQHPEIRPYIRINIVGFDARRYLCPVEAFGLGDVISFHETKPYNELIEYIKKHDLGLIFSYGTESSTARFSSKIFDYMCTRTPVLAIVSEHSLIADLLKETGLGWSVSGNDPEKISEIMFTLYERHQKHDLSILPAIDKITKYSLQKSIIPQIRHELSQIIKEANINAA